ncbi:MAG: hypothetical protein M3Q95_08815 [Bacteroidota bacterium]|nr:hypothetical protein [Bacteroidota bacterium]
MPFFSGTRKSHGQNGSGVLAILLVCSLFFPAKGVAQKVNAQAKVDTATILIGDQFMLSLEVNHPSNMQVIMPAVPDTFALFEKVKQEAVDTIVQQSDKSITLRQHFKFTSFDSGYHVIPPFAFLYRIPGDTTLQRAESDPILISVQTIPVDTTRAIKDIKGQMVIPYSWKDALPYAGGLLLAGLIFLIVFYLYKKFRKVKTVPVIQVPKRPAHEIAFEALQQLDEAKLWQQGKYKAYFTGLSDIIRMFVENRWSVSAMEMTTEEIIHMQIISRQEPAVFEQVKNLLELADLVKFAKVIPVLHENEQSMKHAVAFVKANQQTNEVKEVEA